MELKKTFTIDISKLFLDIGNTSYFVAEAVNEGVRRGYDKGYIIMKKVFHMC